MAPASKLLRQSSLDALFCSNPNRLETIRRNLDSLEKLGLASTSPASKPQVRNRIPKTPPLLSVVLRRSTRKRGPPSPPSDDVDDPQLPGNVVVVDSSVFRYACDGENDSSFISPSPISENLASLIVGFKLVGEALSDPSLTKIYTLDSCFLGQERFLVAAGGHGGFISVYGGGGTAVEEDGTQTPLMSWKGCSELGFWCDVYGEKSNVTDL